MEVKQNSSSTEFIGIDFGAHYVKLTKCGNDQSSSVILENKLSKKKSLCTVSFDGLSRVFGRIEKIKKSAQSTVLMFRDLFDKKIEDVGDLKFYYPMPLCTCKENSQNVGIEFNNTVYPIDLFCLMYLKYLVTEYELNLETEQITLSIPSYYNENQVCLLKTICNSIGLNNVDFLFDYLASALAFGYENDNSLKGDKYVIILDMGYITTNCTVVKYYKGGMEILSVDYIQYGGRDIDQQLIDIVADKIKAEKDVDIKKSPVLYLKAEKAIEDGKEKLSAEGADTVELKIESVKDDDDFEMVLLKEDIEKKLGSTRIENELKSLLNRCYDLAEIPKDYKNTEIVIVGGSLRIPYFQNILLEYLHSISEEKNLTKTLNMDENVAYGCLYFNKIKNGLWKYEYINNKDENYLQLMKRSSNDSYEEYVKKLNEMDKIFDDFNREKNEISNKRNTIDAIYYSNKHKIDELKDENEKKNYKNRNEKYEKEMKEKSDIKLEELIKIEKNFVELQDQISAAVPQSVNNSDETEKHESSSSSHETHKEIIHSEENIIVNETKDDKRRIQNYVNKSQLNYSKKEDVKMTFNKRILAISPPKTSENYTPKVKSPLSKQITPPKMLVTRTKISPILNRNRNNEEKTKKVDEKPVVVQEEKKDDKKREEKDKKDENKYEQTYNEEDDYLESKKEMFYVFRFEIALCVAFYVLVMFFS